MAIMATRQQAATAVLDESAAEDTTPDKEADPVDAEVIEWATPGTMTARGYVAPLSDFLTWVDYDGLEGVKGFRIGIRLGVAFRVIRRKEEAPGKSDYERWLRTLALVAPEFEGWPVILDPLTQQPIPQPTADDYNTYAPIGWWTGAFPDLGRWIMKEGFDKAYKKATAPN